MGNIIAPFTAEIIGWGQAAERVFQIPTSLNCSAAKVESQLGKFTPPGSNNWHGFKDPHGVVTSTREQTSGGVNYTINAGFMVFKSPADSFMYYGHLLGLGSPYHDMVTKFLASPRGPADVQALSNSLTHVYASDGNYGTALIAVQNLYHLYDFDLKGAPPMVQTAATPVATPPRVTPTVSQGVRIDWGSFLDQFIEHEKPIIEAVAVQGEQLALSQIPMGSIVNAFIGPKLVQQYVDQGLTALEGMLADKSFTADPASTLQTTVANLINSSEKQLVGWLGPQLDGMIAEAIAKLGLKPAS